MARAAGVGAEAPACSAPCYSSYYWPTCLALSTEATSMKNDAAGPGLGRPKPRSDAGALVLFATIAALYFTREILIPFAFALTFAFLLTPVVALLQRLRIGRVVSVLMT